MKTIVAIVDATRRSPMLGLIQQYLTTLSVFILFAIRVILSSIFYWNNETFWVHCLEVDEDHFTYLCSLFGLTSVPKSIAILHTGL